MSTRDQSQKFHRMISKATHNTTFSPGSADGVSRSKSPDGLQLDLFGQDPAPANLSALQEKDSAKQTPGTFGHFLQISSTSATLQLCLESRLRALLGESGSPEYSLIWKKWDIDGQAPICALRASGRLISASGFSGWPTPRAEDSESTGAHRGKADTMTSAARLAGWVTPSARDWKDSAGMSITGTNPDGTKRSRLDQLPRQAAIAGIGLKSSRAQTEKRGGLNPDLPRWLMGFPRAWCACAATVMLSFPKSPRHLSPRISQRRSEENQ